MQQIKLIIVFFMFVFLISTNPIEAQIKISELVQESKIASKDNNTLYFVDFWATWCGPCVYAKEMLTVLQGQYPDKFYVISISDESPEKVKKYITKRPTKLAIATDFENSTFTENKVISRPYGVLFNAKGDKIWKGHPSDLSQSMMNRFLRENKSTTSLNNFIEIVKTNELLEKDYQPKSDIEIFETDQVNEIISIEETNSYLKLNGSFKDILGSTTLTANYLNKTLEIELPKKRRTSKYSIEIVGARENNLKNIDVTFPLNMLTVVTGVSGSGKSTLVKKLLYPALQKKLTGFGDKPGQYTDLKGNFSNVSHVEFVDQNPIGRSSRSNPVTYIKAYDDIRALYSSQKLSKIRNYQAKHFSFNVDGGRCETCKGEGEVTIEMQFMADVHLTCETCNGKRFKKDVLEVQFHNTSIDDILNMTIDDAINFFTSCKETKIQKKLQPLQDVGLGYVTLGQSSSTLSGGEAQRIKLASFLGKGSKGENTLFIFDEPTTGLHFHDIKKLLKSFQALIEIGHSIIVIEHNIDLIKCADYIIDLGPEGGKHGGDLVAQGTPEDIIKTKKSLTGKYLIDKL